MWRARTSASSPVSYTHLDVYKRQVLCVAALALFIAFYPLESGMPVSRAYASLLRWFNWINF